MDKINAITDENFREFLITSKGVDIVDVYTGPAGVLTGSARLTQENKDKAAEDIRKEEIQKLQRDLERQRKLTLAQVTALEVEFKAKEEEIKQKIAQEKRLEKTSTDNRKDMARLRKEDKASHSQKGEHI